MQSIRINYSMQRWNALHAWNRRRCHTNLEKYVLFGEKAIDRLTANVMFGIPPVSSPSTFLAWARYKTAKFMSSPRDSFFKIGVKIKEVTSQDAVKRCTLDFSSAEEKLYEQDANGDSIGAKLDKLNMMIKNAEIAIENMKMLLAANAGLPESSDVHGGQRARLEAAIRYLPHKEITYKIRIQQRDKLKECEVYKNYLVAQKRRDEVYAAANLTPLLEDLKNFNLGKSKGKTDRGKSFEDIATEVTRFKIIPYLAAKHRVRVEDIFLMRNTKFGLAKVRGETHATEFDCLVCIAAQRPSRLDPLKPSGIFSTVLGIVEV
jgi:hypothetical protein